MIARDPDARAEMGLSESPNLELVGASAVPNYVRSMATERVSLQLEGDEAPKHAVLIDEDVFSAGFELGGR